MHLGWELNSLNQMVEVRGLCRGCDLSERNKAAARRSRLRKEAYLRRLRNENAELMMEFDAIELIHQETVREQQNMEDLMMAAKAAQEEVEKWKEATA